jgi:hypothetical protein
MGVQIVFNNLTYVVRSSLFTNLNYNLLAIYIPYMIKYMYTKYKLTNNVCATFIHFVTLG